MRLDRACRLVAPTTAGSILVAGGVPRLQLASDAIRLPPRRYAGRRRAAPAQRRRLPGAAAAAAAACDRGDAGRDGRRRRPARLARRDAEADGAVRAPV